MNEDAMRKAFEDEVRANWTEGYGCPRNMDGSYVNAHVATYWRFWQAATRAAVPVWHPIETAQKDGKDVLVYTHNGLVRLAFFDTARGGIWSSWPGRNEYTPTHWMPLPPAPK